MNVTKAQVVPDKVTESVREKSVAISISVVDLTH